MRAIDASHYLLAVSLQREAVPSFDAYPFCLPAVRHLAKLEFHPRVTFIIGENGSGKSTLLEAIAVSLGLNAEGGSRSFHFSTRPSHSCLHEHLQLHRGIRRPRDVYFLRAESFFNVATDIEASDNHPDNSTCPEPPIISYYGGRSLHEQSHGESFWSLLSNRLGGHGLYLLDEPEAALSPMRQLAMLSRIHQLVQQNSQLIISTHSPILLAYPHATIWHLQEHGLAKVAYTDTDHYRITKAFLTRHDTMLAELLKDDEDRAGSARPA